MKTNQDIAIELAHRTCTKYLHIPDSSSIQYSFSARHLADFVEKLVAAVDAERGKVVGEVFNLPGTMGGFTTCAFRSVDVPAGSKLFLSSTISLGFALVPIDPSEEWIEKVVRVNQPDLDIGCRAWREEVESLEYWHKAMIQAAGVTK